MRPDEVPTVTVTDIPSAVPTDGTLFLLDVREAEEWAAGRIAEATHIPMDEVPGRLGELPRDTRVITVCRSGARSAVVTNYLVAHGWDAYNLAGGMMAWAALSRPMTGDGPAPYVL